MLKYNIELLFAITEEEINNGIKRYNPLFKGCGYFQNLKSAQSFASSLLSIYTEAAQIDTKARIYKVEDDFSQG